MTFCCNKPKEKCECEIKSINRIVDMVNIFFKHWWCILHLWNSSHFLYKGYLVICDHNSHAYMAFVSLQYRKLQFMTLAFTIESIPILETMQSYSFSHFNRCPTLEIVDHTLSHTQNKDTWQYSYILNAWLAKHITRPSTRTRTGVDQWVSTKDNSWATNNQLQGFKCWINAMQLYARKTLFNKRQ